MTKSNNKGEISDADYLRDLSERLRGVPVMYGVDGFDIDNLWELAKRLDSPSNNTEGKK